jgi:hypothetical protein
MGGADIATFQPYGAVSAEKGAPVLANTLVSERCPHYAGLPDLVSPFGYACPEAECADDGASAVCDYESTSKGR